MQHHVFLVPGFFGFANFGDFRYFAHVRERIETWTRVRGIRAKVHFAPTAPTASLRLRAGRLLDLMHELAGKEEGPIHLIGHSTGGLDARLAVTPKVNLKTSVDAEPLARRVRSIVAVATPHFGAPTAAFFSSVLGQRILSLFSLITVQALRVGTIPLPALVVLASALGQTGAGKLFSGGVIEQVYDQVLKNYSPEVHEQIAEVFEEVRKDQSLLLQLTPEGLDLFNALVVDREGVRRGSVITQAKPPSLGRQARIGANPSDQAMYNVYRALHSLASQLDPDMLPALTPAQRNALEQVYGAIPKSEDNDGIVPTLSQVWGTVVHVAWADHLDVIGHFHGQDRTPLHVDWIRTMSGFDRSHFENMWNDVARFLFVPPTAE